MPWNAAKRIPDYSFDSWHGCLESQSRGSRQHAAFHCLGRVALLCCQSSCGYLHRAAHIVFGAVFRFDCYPWIDSWNNLRCFCKRSLSGDWVWIHGHPYALLYLFAADEKISMYPWLYHAGIDFRLWARGGFHKCGFVFFIFLSRIESCSERRRFSGGSENAVASLTGTRHGILRTPL